MPVKTVSVMMSTYSHNDKKKFDSLYCGSCEWLWRHQECFAVAIFSVIFPGKLETEVHDTTIPSKKK